MAYALTLRDSLLSTQPDCDFHIFLADDPLAEDALPGVSVIPVAALGRPNWKSMAFRYTIMEFATSIKAWCFQHLLQGMAYEAAIYLDPDIQVFAPLLSVHDALAKGASSVLTPHLSAPLDDEAWPNNIDILRSGTFNLGFVAFSNVPEANAFLNWWATQLEKNCYSNISHGLFVDQKFVDFAPSFLEKLSILHHPGYNVAYWNLANRNVAQVNLQWRVNGTPLIFYHFSGVVPGDDTVFSKHQNRFTMENVGPSAELVRAYLTRLNENGHSIWVKTPYRFGKFEDGTNIIPPMRRHPPKSGDAEVWFKAPEMTFWNAPSENVDQQPGYVITRLMRALHEARPDLQAQFPLSCTTGRLGFHAWFLAHGGPEYHIDPPYISAATHTKISNTTWRARLKLWLLRQIGRL